MTLQEKINSKFPNTDVYDRFIKYLHDNFEIVIDEMFRYERRNCGRLKTGWLIRRLSDPTSGFWSVIEVTSGTATIMNVQTGVKELVSPESEVEIVSKGTAG